MALGPLQPIKRLIMSNTESVTSEPLLLPAPAKVRKISRARPDFVPTEYLIELRELGLLLSEIAELCGISESAVSKRLKAARTANRGLEIFKSRRADILARVQHRLINSLTDSDIKSMSGYQRLVGMGILYDKERLERGQSTSNVSVQQIDAELSDIDKAIRETQAQLDELTGAAAE